MGELPGYEGLSPEAKLAGSGYGLDPDSGQLVMLAVRGLFPTRPLEEFKRKFVGHEATDGTLAPVIDLGERRRTDPRGSLGHQAVRNSA